jgi:hypothetical protein
MKIPTPDRVFKDIKSLVPDSRKWPNSDDKSAIN